MLARKLTARFVETVVTAQEREDIRDIALAGLQLRVTRQGAKTWAVRYTRASDGRRRRLTLGTYPNMSLEEARTRAREELAAVARGADPAGSKQIRKDADTFSEVAEDWMERHGKPNKGSRTLRDDRSMLDRHILPEIGAVRAVEITKRDVIRLLDTVAAKTDARSSNDKKAGTARRLTHRPNRVFELVRSIFRWAVGRDILKIDPTFGLSPPIKKEKARERDLSPAEIRLLWYALDKAPISRPMKREDGDFPMTRATALALKLALATAQRIGEVTGIAATELDLNDTAPMWTVPGERSKNGKANRVPLSPLAVQLIAEAYELAGDNAWLFPSPTGTAPIDPHAPTKALGRARPAIGLEDFRIHDLRRTAATRMAEMGISPHTISLVLNHVTARQGTITSKVYVQYSYDREKREALNAWGTRLQQIVANTTVGNVIPFPQDALTGD
jgi:integrase